MQALAELYHIQPPLIPEEGCVSVQVDDTDKQQGSSTPTDQVAAKGTAEVASELGSKFISRQELGMCSSADNPMTDSLPLDEVAAATVGDTRQQDTPAALAPADDSHSQLSNRPPQSTKLPSKPLCSQEWNIQHVSLSVERPT